MPEHIVIIDDGINEGYYRSGPLIANMEITPELHIRPRTGYDRYQLSHGTNCAAIIRKHAPDALLSSIKIIGDEGNTARQEQLLQALTWCLSHPVDLINLSLGTLHYRDFESLAVVIRKLAAQGTLIVAACHNRNVVTCPASLPQVIGVKCDADSADNTAMIPAPRHRVHTGTLDGINITATGEHLLVNYRGEERQTSASNSYAAPYVTSLVYAIIHNNPGASKEAVLAQLQASGQRGADDGLGQTCAEEIDIPIIAIIDSAVHMNSHRGKRIWDQFRQEGYYAVAISSLEEERDPCRGMVPLPGDEYSRRMIMPEVWRRFDPDVMFLLLTVSESDRAFLQAAESVQQVDIKVRAGEDGYAMEALIDADSADSRVYGGAAYGGADSRAYGECFYADALDSAYCWIRQQLNGGEDEILQESGQEMQAPPSKK